MNTQKIIYLLLKITFCTSILTFYFLNNSVTASCSYDYIDACANGYTYNVGSSKCEKTITENVFCNEGYTFDTNLGKCKQTGTYNMDCPNGGGPNADGTKCEGWDIKKRIKMPGVDFYYCPEGYSMDYTFSNCKKWVTTGEPLCNFDSGINHYPYDDNTKYEGVVETSVVMAYCRGTMLQDKSCSEGFTYISGNTCSKLETTNPSCTTGTLLTSGTNAGKCKVETTCAVNGVCGSTLNSCIDGDYGDVTDQGSLKKWKCSGKNNGTTDYCELQTDTTAPTASVTYEPNGWSSSSIKVNITCSDGGSGCNMIDVSGWNKNGNTYSAVFTKNGSSTEFRVYDNAGNVRTVNYHVNKIDTTAPTGSLTHNVGWYNNGQTISFSAQDTGGSRLKKMQLQQSTNGGAFVAISGQTYDNLNATGEVSRTFTRSVSGGNKYKYKLVVWDYAGNQTTIGGPAGELGFDTTGPTSDITYSKTGWTNQDVKITIGCADSQSGCNGANISGWNRSGNTYTKIFSSDASGSINIKDSVGNVKNVPYSITQIDKGLPSAQVTYSPTTWTNQAVTVTVTCSDNDSGCNMKNVSGWTKSGNSYKAVFTQNTTGNFTVFDNAGNAKQVSYNVNKIDTTAPTGTVSHNVGWKKNSQTITFSAKDTGGSKLKRMYLQESVNGGTFQYVSGQDYNNLNTTSEITKTYTRTVVSGNTYRYQLIAWDYAGNKTVIGGPAGEIAFDTTAPVGTVGYSTIDWTNQNVKVSIGCSDTQSGCDMVNITGWSKSGNVYTRIFSADTSGSITLRDKVGNTKNMSYSITKIDKGVPSGSVTYTPNTWTNQPVTVKITCSDSDSGCNMRNVSGWSKSGNTYTAAFTKNTTGSFTVVDNAGNTKSIPYNVDKIDTIAPTGTVSHNVGWYKNNQTITFSARDTGGSRLKRMYLQESVNGGAFQYVAGQDYNNLNTTSTITRTYTRTAVNGNKYRYRLFTWDVAGNVAVIGGPAGDLAYDTQAPSNPTINSPSHTPGVWSNVNTAGFSILKNNQGPSPSDNYYCIDTTNTCNPNIAGNSKIYNDLTSNTRYFRAKTCDTGGCSTTTSFELKVDVDKPTGDVSYPTGWYNSAQDISYVASDTGGSTLKNVRLQVSKDGGAFVDVANQVFDNINTNNITKGYTQQPISGDPVGNSLDPIDLDPMPPIYIDPIALEPVEGLGEPINLDPFPIEYQPIEPTPIDLGPISLDPTPIGYTPPSYDSPINLDPLPIDYGSVDYEIINLDPTPIGSYPIDPAPIDYGGLVLDPTPIEWGNIEPVYEPLDYTPLPVDLGNVGIEMINTDTTLIDPIVTYPEPFDFGDYTFDPEPIDFDTIEGGPRPIDTIGDPIDTGGGGEIMYDTPIYAQQESISDNQPVFLNTAGLLGKTIYLPLSATPETHSGYRYRMVATDNAGNTTVIDGPEEGMNFDLTPPTVSANNASTSQWRNNRINITLQVGDEGGSGVAYAKYRWDNSDCLNGVDFTNGSTIQIPSQGTHTLYLCAGDVAGNTKTWSGIYKYDAVKPTVSDNYINDDIWTNQSATITLNPNDPNPNAANSVSDIKTTKYCWGTSCLPVAGTGATSINVGPDTQNILRYQTYDHAGNSSTRGSISVKIEDDAPSTTLGFTKSGGGTYTPNSWTNNNVLATINCDDGQSGIISGCNTATYQYRVENSSFDCTSSGTWNTATNFSIETGNNTNKTVYVCSRVKDNAGNGYSYSPVYQINIDKILPRNEDVDTSTGHPSNNEDLHANNRQFGYQVNTNGGAPIIAIEGYFEDAQNNDALTVAQSSTGSTLTFMGDITKVDNDTTPTDGQRTYTFVVTKIEDEAGNVTTGTTAAPIKTFNYSVYAELDNISTSITYNTLDVGNVANGNTQTLSIELKDVHGNRIIPVGDINRNIAFKFTGQNSLYLDQYNANGDSSIFLKLPKSGADFDNSQFSNGENNYTQLESNDGLYTFEYKVYTPTYDGAQTNGQQYVNGGASIDDIGVTITQDTGVNMRPETEFSHSVSSTQINFDFVPMVVTQFSGDFSRSYTLNQDLENEITYMTDGYRTPSFPKTYIGFGMIKEAMNAPHDFLDFYVSDDSKYEGHTLSNNIDSLYYWNGYNVAHDFSSEVKQSKPGLTEEEKKHYISSHLSYSLDGKTVIYNSAIIGKSNYSQGTLQESGANLGAKVLGNVQSKNQADVSENQSEEGLIQIGNNTKADLKEQIYKNVAEISMNVIPTPPSTITNLAGDTWHTAINAPKVSNQKVLLTTGMVTLSPGVNRYSGNKTLVVQGGDLYITHNLLADNRVNDMLGIIVLSDEEGNGGNVYVDPSVTAIEAIIFSDKAMMNYDGTQIQTNGTALKNQFYFYGTLFSENTLGGYVAQLCPYYVETCDFAEAKKYDLNFFRSYYVYDGDDDNSDQDQASGTSYFGYGDDRFKYPVIFEYNSMIQSNPPKLFELSY